MRIVEYEKETTAIPFLALKLLGMAAAIFSLVVLALLLANHLSLKRNDPIHSPALLQLTEQLKADPQNERLQEQIRELDYLARRAFFSSQHFNQLAIYLLLAGLAATVVAFKSLQACQQRLPYPDSKERKDDLIAGASWARKSVAVAGLILAGAALVLAIPWKSRLSELEKSMAANVTSDSFKRTEDSIPSGIMVSATLPIPSQEDILRNWPGFRGPNGGHAPSTHLPAAWDGQSGQGIIWKTEIPRTGFNSPIIWDNRIFLSGGDQEAREVFAFDTETGALLWRREIRDIPGSPAVLPKVASDTGFAAATMTTDGLRVFAIFATGDLVALDFEGNNVWGRNLGVPKNPYGHGSSLTVYEDLLLVQYDHEGNGALFGLDVATGETRWHRPRPFGASWSSPLLIEWNGRAEVILAAAPAVVSYDPRTGSELWQVDCLARGEVAPTPVFAHGLVYVAADYVGLLAIDISSRDIVWKTGELLPGVCTPIVAGEFLIYGLNYGGIVCRDAKTGQELWFEETDEGFYASPVAAGNRIYLMDRTGVMHIFPPGPEFKSLATPSLGEEAVATPAIIGNSIFSRGAAHLFRIGS
jgi:outer membrane protein assembly factor BamB